MKLYQKFQLIIILFFIIIKYESLVGQNIVEFKPLISNGDIPDDFIELPSIQYYSDIQSLDTLKNKKNYALAKRFFLESNYSMDYILNSGYVLYNDSISIYANKILDNILSSNKKLRNEIKIYTLKSSEVNAYSTDKGIIFITIGLMAQIQNEAQLAWILCHELVHYKYKHNIDSYIAKNDIYNQESNNENNSKDLKLASFCDYSKEKEFEADTKGLNEFYSKTDYSINEVKKIFDVLLYSYLPIEEIDFNKSFFETTNFKFPENYSLKELIPITAIENYDDTKSTHPNIKKRREEINKIIDKSDFKGDEKFLIYSENDFLKTRQIARFELCNIFLQSRQYEDAIYTAYSIIIKDQIKNKYLEEIISRSLYGLCKYKNKGGYNNIHLHYKNEEGSKSNLIYFFDKISKKELNTLAIQNIWKLISYYPEKNYLRIYFDDLLRELISVNKLIPDSFYKNIENIDTLPNFIKLSDEEISKLDKYEKIKYMKLSQNSNTEKIINYKYALIDLLKDEQFVKHFIEYKEKYLVNDDYQLYSPVINKKQKENSKKEIDNFKNVILINPLVICNTKDEIDFLTSEKNEISIINKLTAYSNKIGFNLSIIDNKLFNNTETEKFNDYVIISNWKDELILHDDTSLINTSFIDINKIIKKYNTKYFAWLNIEISNAKSHKRFSEFLKYSTTIFGILFGLNELIKPVYELRIKLNVFDITSNKVITTYNCKIKQRNDSDIINSHLYNMINSLN